MKSKELLLIIVLFVIIDARYILYNSNDEYRLHGTFDCLYAYSRSFSKDIIMLYDSIYKLIPYRRLDENEELEELSIVSYENVLNKMTFTELYREGITSTELLQWASPIDIAERYEKNSKNSSEIFYNCSLPWFGSICQYRFDNNIGQFIFNFSDDLSITKDIIIDTCYPLLNDCYCGPSSVCLDWREICDGINDCLNGEDEQLCELLEINQCINNEFRCHYGGQCIPSKFVDDGKMSTDCLDGTDELNSKLYHRDAIDYQCHQNSIFQCEELTGPRSFTYLCPRGIIHLVGTVDNILDE
ncbi:unnamed protein product [Rotaria sp. Silwood1]|nr:unnamed protein product [Rotaria sp. Silwood1]CAF4844309.1 unnamed protein product [Rotaria sp. Silwood1]